MKAGDNFEFLGLHKGSDWGIRMSKNITLTIDVGEGKIVTLGCGVTSDTGGAIKKTGAGLLVMNDVTGGTADHTKSYSGGTTIEEGTVRFEAASFGTGAVTVKDGAVLELVPGSTLPSGNDVTLENGATLAAPESGAAAQIGGACTFATNSTLEFVISGASNSSFAFTTAPTGSATVKFTSGFNPAPGTEFILATGVGECKFTLDPKYPGELKVENGNLVYKARDYFYIRLTKSGEDDDGLNVDPVWFYENSMLGNSIDEDTVKSTAPNGMSYIDSYLMGYEPLDPDSNFKLTGASGAASGEFKAAATFNIPAHSPINGGTYKAEAVLLASSNGVAFSRVANVKPVVLTPGDGEQVAEFSFTTSDLGDREMRFFA